jgi:SAM-dependent methyltransferase
MNYGYTSLNSSKAVLPLRMEDEPNRYGIQLYHFVATHLGTVRSLDGLEVLEVGCGRGGGCDYIRRYLNPGRMVGLDFSLSAIAFCNQNFLSSKLVYLPGDAEALPFVDNCFDIVINVESSHCYRSIEAFFREVKRVLKNGGHFLFADLRWVSEMRTLKKSMRNNGMRLLEEIDITANVVKALSLDHDRKLAHIQRSSPRIIINPVKEYAGLRGSKIYKKFQTREVKYLCYILRKA